MSAGLQMSPFRVLMADTTAADQDRAAARLHALSCAPHDAFDARRLSRTDACITLTLVRQ